MKLPDPVALFAEVKEQLIAANVQFEEGTLPEFCPQYADGEGEQPPAIRVNGWVCAWDRWGFVVEHNDIADFLDQVDVATVVAHLKEKGCQAGVKS